MPVISTCACSSATPGASRPIAVMKLFSRFCSCLAEKINGRHSSTGPHISRGTKLAGITPTTVASAPSIRICRPMMSRSEAKRFSQHSWLRTTAGAAPGLVSSGAKVRPSSGATPSIGSKGKRSGPENESLRSTRRPPVR